MTGAIHKNDESVYGLNASIPELLSDCTSLLIVGQEDNEVSELVTVLKDSNAQLDISRANIQEVGSSKDSAEYDCVLFNWADTSTNSDQFERALIKCGVLAKNWVLVATKNGFLRNPGDNSNKHSIKGDVSKVDFLRNQGFKVHGISGIKQLRTKSGKAWLNVNLLGNWAIRLSRDVCWIHPRQSYRLFGIKAVREDISTYYSNDRHEMSGFIPHTASRVLDVGCGAGNFGKYLKKYRNLEVWGVEYSNEAARFAANKLDKVINADINEAISALPRNYFDCIVFNDVLEHLVDPYTVLVNTKQLLSKNGVVVASIPNVRHIGVLRELLFLKDWKYKDSGVLDRTHLRFFTKRSIIRMFADAGFVCEKIEGIGEEYTFSYFLINLLSLGNALDSRYIQYSCTARPV